MADDKNTNPVQTLADLANGLQGRQPELGKAHVTLPMFNAMTQFGGYAQIEVLPEKQQDKGKIVVGAMDTPGANPLPAAVMSEGVADLVKAHPEVLKAALAYAMAAKAVPAKANETAEEKAARLEKIDGIAMVVDNDPQALKVKAFGELLDAAGAGKTQAAQQPQAVQKAMQLMQEGDKTLNGGDKEQLVSAWKEALKSRAAGTNDTGALDNFAGDHPELKASVEALKKVANDMPPIAAGISGSENVREGTSIVQADLTTNAAARKAKIEGRQ